MEEKRYSVSEKILDGILGYLGTCKYQEVAQIITALQQDAKEIKVSEDKSEDSKK